MGEFAGIDVVKAKAFTKPSQPLGKTLMLLQFQPHLSTASEAVYAREFEAQIGYAQVPLRQEVHRRRAPTPRQRHARAAPNDYYPPAHHSDPLRIRAVCAVHGAPAGQRGRARLPRQILQAQRLRRPPRRGVSRGPLALEATHGLRVCSVMMCALLCRLGGIGGSG